MSFGTAVKTCFSKMFVFSGRARRSEFWWYYLFLTIVSTVVMVVLFIIFFVMMAPIFSEADPVTGEIPDEYVGDFLWATVILYGGLVLMGFVFLIMALGAEARRLHDTGQSAHWLWFHLAGLSIVPFIMCAMEGQPHENQYGPDPKAFPVA